MWKWLSNNYNRRAMKTDMVFWARKLSKYRDCP